MAVGAFLTPIGSAWAAGNAVLRQEPARNLSPLPMGSAPVATAEVGFEVPRWFATVVDLSTTRQRLYGAGDILIDPKGFGGEYRITQIEENRLQLGDLHGRKPIWINLGSLIPGRPGWRFTGTPRLRAVEYRYVPTSGPLDVEPRVLELRGDQATLEVDISSSSSASLASPSERKEADLSPARSLAGGKGFEHTLLGRVRVKPTAQDSYEINAADLNAALDQSVQFLAETWPRIWPSVSFQHGVNFDIQSPIADGTLGPRGFRVTSANLAERGGLDVGDVILGVNGQPVKSFSDVYRVYHQMRRDPHLSIIQLDLERQGQPLTKTYRIR